jgi:hypothetical protein
MGKREVRVQFQRPAQRARGLGEVTQPIEQNALSQVYPRVTIVVSQRCLHLGVRFCSDASQLARPYGTAH